VSTFFTAGVIMPDSFAEIPLHCPRCGSSSIVPVIMGPLSLDLIELATLKQIYTGGCFSDSEGDPLWACADCLETISDEHYLDREGNRRTVLAHARTVREVFARHRPMSEDELCIIQGRSFLEILLRNEFPFGCDHGVLRSDQDGLSLDLVTPQGDCTIKEQYFREGFLDRAIKFIRSQTGTCSEPKCTMRIDADNESCSFEVAVLEDSVVISRM